MARAGLASLLALTFGCAPPTIELGDFEGVGFIAALQLDADGALRSASEVRALVEGEGLGLYSGDEPLVLVGWASESFGDRAVPTDAPLVARTGCAPRLPPPMRALRLEGDALQTLSPAGLPPLSAAWAGALCPALDPERLAFAASCRAQRCPVEVRSTGLCQLEVDIPCIDARLAARVEPDGALCLTSARDVASSAEDACVNELAPASAVGRARCTTPEACVVDAYLAPDRPALTVERVAVSEAARLVPDVGATGVLGKLPSVGHLIGLAHDLAVLGDRVYVSTATVARSNTCGDSLLRAYSRDDLRLVGTATASRCLLVLSAAADVLLGLAVEGQRFTIDVYDPQLRLLRRVPLDDRVAAGAGEPPVSVTACERAVELLVDDARVYAVLSRGNPINGCPERAGVVHVFDRRALTVVARRALTEARPWRAKLLDGALWVADSDGLRVTAYRLPDLAERERYDVPPGFARTDVALFDFALDHERGELVVATTRDQPAIRRDAGPGPFEDRAYFMAREADPVAVWAAPFAGARGLVLGTRDGDARWPTEAALYDREAFVILPGAVEIGYGPARRLLHDGAGGVLTLLPWEGALVRVRPAR